MMFLVHIIMQRMKEDQRGFCLGGVLKFGLLTFHLNICKTNPSQNHAHVIQIISN